VPKSPSWVEKDGVAVVDLATSAWAFDGYHALCDVVEELQANDSVRVVVVTGSPGAEPYPASKGFYGHEQFTRYIETFLFRLHKPFIIAVDGSYRHGITLMLLADIVVAEEQVSWRDAHVEHGTVSASGPFLWPLLTGLNSARRYILTGESFTARQGQEMGIVTEVVDSGGALATAMKYATRMAEMEPTAIQMTKRTMNQWLRLGFDTVLQRGLGFEWLTIPDAVEARDRPWEQAQ
jgi:enoyl-CoA hydratase/carnithine racemase